MHIFNPNILERLPVFSEEPAPVFGEEPIYWLPGLDNIDNRESTWSILPINKRIKYKKNQ